jgi:(4S)-4-hydroxy-5-phosphonooxypentane-2,3-dione isomerase
MEPPSWSRSLAAAQRRKKKEHGVPDRVVLVARYNVKPGNVEAVLDALRRMVSIVRANEPGCTAFHVNRGKDDPNTLLLYEEYVDQDAVDAHGATPHFQEIILGTVVPLLERREREFFTPALRS